MGPQPPRSRPSARKRLDDSAFIGPSGVKRSNVERDKVDVTDARVKRKRVEPSPSINTGGTSVRRVDKGYDEDAGPSMLDFALLPTDALHRYLMRWDLVPTITPSPHLTDRPPLPIALLHPPRAHSPRRDTNRRRSSRLSDEEFGRGEPILADVVEIHDALAAIAQRHWEKQSIKEVDSVVQFLQTVGPTPEALPA